MHNRPEHWTVDYPVEARIATPALFVGEWVCHRPAPGPGASDRTEHVEIWLQREGSHSRRSRRDEVVADPATVLVRGPAEAAQIAHPSTARQRATVVLIPRDMAGAVPRTATLARSARVATLHYRLQRLLLAAADPLQTEEVALGLAEQVLGELAGAPPATPSRRGEAVAAQVRHLLVARHREPLTLEAIAREVRVSPFHLSRTFRAATGTPIHRYLNRLRLRVALDRLVTEEGDLSRLALDVGFASHSHFTDTFRREFGVPPSRLQGRGRLARAMAERGAARGE